MLQHKTGYYDDMPDEAFDEHFKWLDNIAEKNGISQAIWSADNVDFDTVAFPVTVKRIRHLTCWCPETYAEVPPNATWLDVWKILDDLICESGDSDHCFIETFDIDGDTVRVFFGS